MSLKETVAEPEISVLQAVIEFVLFDGCFGRSRMLESLAACLTELCASEFYLIFFSFWLFLIF